jgi:predicted ATPase
MITSIKLTNFKCFKSLPLEMRALNVFAGMNGAGKSTVIQSLLVVRQSWESDGLIRGRLQLNGSRTELGTARDVYCAEPNSEFVELNFTSSTEPTRIALQSRQSETKSKEYHLEIDAAVGPEIDQFNLFKEPFNYLHAERVGPRKAFQIPPDEGHHLSVGRYGENAPFIVASLERRQERVQNVALHLVGAEGKTLPTLQYQWPLWMGRLFPGFAEESEIYPHADQGRLGLALQQKQTGQSLFVRPTNTGFGVSFVLGIIVAGLLAQPDTVLIVENPEAHLHPRAQSGIGEFLARVAAGGAQVFVETHSEHVLNGMRRMVRQTLLTPDTIRLHYFAQMAGNIEPSSKTIPVLSSGDISEWPDGFFDQLDHDLKIILD